MLVAVLERRAIDCCSRRNDGLSVHSAGDRFHLCRKHKPRIFSLEPPQILQRLRRSVGARSPRVQQRILRAAAALQVCR